jgi:hypothetical protein
MHSQDLTKVDILRWGGRATGSNIDWCLTPGIKQKATSAMSLYPPVGYKSRDSWATKKEPIYLKIKFDFYLSIQTMKSMESLKSTSF